MASTVFVCACWLLCRHDRRHAAMLCTTATGSVTALLVVHITDPFDHERWGIQGKHATVTRDPTICHPTASLLHTHAPTHPRKRTTQHAAHRGEFSEDDERME